MLFQYGFNVTHGASNVAGGMQDVGSNHNVVTSRLDPLSCERLLHVKEPIGQGVLRFIHLLPIAQKGFGDIAVAVLRDRCLVRLHHLQDPARGSSRACTDL